MFSIQGEVISDQFYPLKFIWFWVSLRRYGKKTAKLYYTSWLGSNWEKRTIFWDQSQINWDQFGSIPKPCHPKPRPTTPTDFSEISTVLHQKEKFGFLKIIYSYLSINKRNSFSESESKMSLTWNIFASPLLILLIRAFRNTEKWTAIIQFVVLPSFLPSDSFPHVFCPQILPLPLPSFFALNTRANKFALFSIWRRGQNGGQNHKLDDCRLFEMAR